MAISKELKKQLIEQYVADLSAASNAIVVQQTAIPVTTATQVRKDIKSTQGKYVVVRKRLLLRAIKEVGLPEVSMEDVPGSVILITAEDAENEYGPLKAVNTALKELKKKNEGAAYTFLGWWFEKVWKDGNYVNELANIPSKEELISKLMFMLKYPMQSLASVVDQIAKKAEPTAEIPTMGNGESVLAAEVAASVIEEAPVQEESIHPESEIAAWVGEGQVKELDASVEEVAEESSTQEESKNDEA
jgi:large subunit ribosomal protein L10